MLKGPIGLYFFRIWHQGSFQNISNKFFILSSLQAWIAQSVWCQVYGPVTPRKSNANIGGMQRYFYSPRWPNQPFVQLVTSAHFPGVKRPGRHHHLRLVQRLRMRSLLHLLTFMARAWLWLHLLSIAFIISR